MEFKNHLQSYLSEEEINKLMDSLQDENNHAVLLNTRKMNDDFFISLFPNVTPHPIVKHAYLYNKNEYDLGKTIYHDLGCFYLQEPSAMVVSYLLNPKENEVVLDLCAAPGGKTVQASFLMNNKGVIISNDLSNQRAHAILQNVERLGIGNVIITSNDFSKIYKSHLNEFDKIILDAPCSGSGMFRKNSLVKDDWTYQKVLKCQSIQKELISYSYDMLKPGGIMIYSTCSFSYEEDETVIQHLLDTTDASLINIPDSPYFYKSKSKIGIHLFPSLFPGEGHYICLIQKPGILKTKNIENDISFLSNKLTKQDINKYGIKKFGDSLFYLNQDVSTKGFSIIRYGIKIGELSGDVIKYDYHYAHYLDKYINEQEIDLDLTYKYFTCEALNIPNVKDFVLLKYKNIPIDFGKGDNRIIKNRLPKALKRKY